LVYQAGTRAPLSETVGYFTVALVRRRALFAVMLAVAAAAATPVAGAAELDETTAPTPSEQSSAASPPVLPMIPSDAPLGESTAQAAGDQSEGRTPEADGNGLNPLVLAIGVLALGALAAAAVHLRASPRGLAGAIGPPRTQAPQPRPAPAVRRRAPGANGTPLPAGGRAFVRSALEPEGYVEIASCLRRVRWAEPTTQPPAPGGWVHVEMDGGRLVAFANHGARKGQHR
jgi:hypothetical protein